MSDVLTLNMGFKVDVNPFSLEVKNADDTKSVLLTFWVD
jgi:hypothetical protein